VARRWIFRSVTIIRSFGACGQLLEASRPVHNSDTLNYSLRIRLSTR
jgi:hypothetical protein